MYWIYAPVLPTMRGEGELCMANKQKIKVAVIGVGNCFSSLYQGFEFYREHDEDVITSYSIHYTKLYDTR